MFRRVLFLIFVGAGVAGSALARRNRIDTVAPLVPELSAPARSPR